MVIKLRHVLNLSLISICLLLAGCFNHPYMFRYAYYPPASDHETALYRLSITIHGAPRKAYVDHTQKKILLYLKKSNGKVLLNRKYSVEGGNIKWSVRWERENEIDIVFYEFGKKYTSHGHEGPKPNACQIFSVNIKNGSSKESYVTGDVPEWVSSRIFDGINRDSKRQIVGVYFPLHEDKIKSTITSVHAIAQELELHQKDVAPGLIGRLAEYSVQGLQLTLHRFDSMGELEVSIQDWGRRELSKRIEQNLKELGPVRIQRIVSLNIPIYQISVNETLKIVGEVAKAHGLSEDSSCPPAYIKCYGDGDVKIQLYHFDAPESIKVTIEDTNSRDRGLKLESSLKKRLPYQRM